MALKSKLANKILMERAKDLNKDLIPVSRRASYIQNSFLKMCAGIENALAGKDKGGFGSVYSSQTMRGVLAIEEAHRKNPRMVVSNVTQVDPPQGLIMVDAGSGQLEPAIDLGYLGKGERYAKTLDGKIVLIARDLSKGLSNRTF